jgi:hypothetical protein
MQRLGDRLRAIDTDFVMPEVQRCQHALTHLDTRLNDIDGEAAQQLAATVLGSASLEVFGEVPMKQLRANALVELNLYNTPSGAYHNLQPKP